MKLYTEEQVKEVIAYYNTEKFVTTDELLKDLILTPIELPSDEEIKEYVKSTGYYGHCTHEYHEGIEDGAKWMRNKIQRI